MSVIKLIGDAPNQVSRNKDLGDLAFQNAASIAGNVGVGGALTVTSNASIGTTATVNKLTVAETTASSGVVFVGNALNGPNAEYGRIRFGTTSNSSAYVDYGGQIASFSREGVDIGDLRFYTSLNAPSTERMRIDPSGNLIQTVNTTAATLTTNQTLTFSIVNNSTLRISVRGSDGTTRTATVALT